jgi:hypothetical protein
MTGRRERLTDGNQGEATEDDMWKFFSRRKAAALLAVLLPAAAAQAQLEGLLGKGGKGMAGMAGQSMSSSSLGNVTGLLQYCVTNNYVGGEDVNSVQDKLTSKLPGGSKSQDPGYNDGLKGVLHGSNGNNVNLAEGGVQDDIKRKVCDTVLAQAKTML